MAMDERTGTVTLERRGFVTRVAAMMAALEAGLGVVGPGEVTA